MGDLVLRYYPSRKSYRIGLVGNNKIFCSGIIQNNLWFKQYFYKNDEITLLTYCYLIKGSGVPVIKLCREDEVYNSYYKELCKAYQYLSSHHLLDKLDK